MSRPVIPAHYGHTGKPWPAGVYWLVELRRENLPTLYWCDAINAQNQTGWSHIPQFAAGFSSEHDAVTAGALAVAPYAGQKCVAQHEWTDA